MKSELMLLSLIAVAGARANEIPPEVVVERAAHVCQACHGSSAREESASIPGIAGQMPLYIQAQLKDFRSQTRAETDVQAYMWGISALLDDTVITGLSEYFAALPAAPGRAGEPDRVAAGRKIFEAGIPDKGVRPCAGCHGAKAEGASVFPRLAGQKAKYILAQLQVFGTRLRPHGILMKNEVAALSLEQMRDLAEYVRSL